MKYLLSTTAWILLCMVTASAGENNATPHFNQAPLAVNQTTCLPKGTIANLTAGNDFDTLMTLAANCENANELSNAFLLYQKALEQDARNNGSTLSPEGQRAAWLASQAVDYTHCAQYLLELAARGGHKEAQEQMLDSQSNPLEKAKLQAEFIYRGLKDSEPVEQLSLYADALGKYVKKILAWLGTLD